MEMRTVSCTACGAPISFEAGSSFAKCPYCETIQFLDENTVQNMTRAAAAYEESQQRMQQERQKSLDEAAYREERKKYEKIRNIWLVLLGVSFMLTGASEQVNLAGIFLALLVFGGLMVHSFKPKNPNGEKAGTRSGFPVDVSDKDRWLALALCFFVGALGIHLFYVGKKGKGILYIFTFGVFGIGVLIDLIKIAAGTFTDAQGRKLR